MQKKFKIIFIVVAVLAFLFVTASILVSIYAPKIVEDQLAQNLKVKVNLGKISLSLPLTITLERLEIGDLASIKKISCTPNLAALLFGKIVLNGLTVVEPVINLVQSADGKLNLPVLEQKGPPPEIFITSLNLRDGKIIFTDKKVSAEGFQCVVNKLNISVAKVALPITSLATNFSASAVLLSAQGEAFGDIVFKGWLDYLAKDMDAQLVLKNLDLTKFSVYYGNFISNKKLTSARLDLSSTFKAQHNDLEVLSNFVLSKIVYAQADSSSLADLGLAKDALDFFVDADGNLKLEFKINTLLDRPELSAQKLRSIILKAAAKNLASQSPQQLADKVANVIDKYKGLGKELKSIFGQ